MRRTRLAVLAAAVALLAAAAALGTADSTAARGRQATGWVASWAASPVRPGSHAPVRTTAGSVTYRQVVHLSLGGSAVRITLSNAYGDGAVRFGPVAVAFPAGHATVVAGTTRPVSFAGQPSVRVAPGAQVTSDPVRLAVPGGADLTVSLHVAGPARVTRHARANATGYLAQGDRVEDVGGQPFTTRLGSWFFLDRVSVRPPDAADVTGIVALGDSITDGARSTPDANRRWPDLLNARLRAAGAPVAVTNAGISGNQLLGQLYPGTGEPAVSRLGRDVLSSPGVRAVVVLEGINDIRAGTRAPALLAAYRQVITRCHTHGLRVVGGTLLPFRGDHAWSPERERTRQRVNAWIRTSGAFDAVVDFDAALRDPRHPERMRARYDSGDHLHPGDAGHAAMASAAAGVLVSRFVSPGTRIG